MGCASSSYTAIPGVGSVRDSLRGSRTSKGSQSVADREGIGENRVSSGPRRLSMRPHSLETRIIQIDQVDTVLMDSPRSSEPDAPFVDGQLGLRDLSPTLASRFPKGTLFSDPDFPADSRGLGFTEPPGLSWSRPAELGVEGPVWQGDRRGRVRTGRFDDRWLAEAMAIVSQRPQLLDKVFGADSSGVDGAIRIRLWRFGQWVTVVVDDELPVPLCITTDSDGELWPAFIEKAFAKIHGSYAGLSDGDALWGLEDLTGGVSQRLHVPEMRPPLGAAQSGAVGMGLGPVEVPRDRESLYVQVYRPLVQALRYGALISCTPKQQTFSLEIPISIVVDTKVTIRGPQVCIQDDMGSSSHWLDLDDFATAYTNIIVTTLSTESEELQVLETIGTWESGISAGGSRNNLEKFAINPQYILNISQPDEQEENKDFGRCSLLLALMQEHRRSVRGSRPPLLPIAYFIYKAEVPRERLGAEYFLLVPEEVDTGPFSNRREIAHRAELDPGNYVIIPATWTAGQNGGFLLRIFTVRKVTLEALPPYKPVCAMLPTWVPVTEL